MTVIFMKRQPELKHFKVLSTIGRRLKSVRKSRNIAPATASRFLRMSVSRLEAIERGEKNYSLELLVRMCDYYEVSVFEIVA
jgi:transcriptional regulator with XRE-family HTH domain